MNGKSDLGTSRVGSPRLLRTNSSTKKTDTGASMIKSDFGEISSREYGKGFVISGCEVSSPDYASHTLLKSILQFEHRLVIQIWSTPGNHPSVIGAHGPLRTSIALPNAAAQLSHSCRSCRVQHSDAPNEGSADNADISFLRLVPLRLSDLRTRRLIPAVLSKVRFAGSRYFVKQSF